MFTDWRDREDEAALARQEILTWSAKSVWAIHSREAAGSKRPMGATKYDLVIDVTGWSESERELLRKARSKRRSEAMDVECARAAPAGPAGDGRLRCMLYDESFLRCMSCNIV